MEPRIQYAKTGDGASIAFCVAGEGTPLLLVPSPPMGHVQRNWLGLGHVSFHQDLAQKFQLVWFDVRGSGLSDRGLIDFSMDAMQADVEAVVDRAGIDQFILCSTFDGVAVAVTYAVKHPERVSHLILLDGWARFDEYDQSASFQAEVSLREQDWHVYTETFAKVLMGVDDPVQANHLAETIRAAVEPEALRAAFGAMPQWDISSLLSEVKASTLVVHSEANRFLSVESGRRLAAKIPDAQFSLGQDMLYRNLPQLLSEFLGEGQSASGTSQSQIHTILFTDVEGSTALTDRLGDAKARELLREHERIVREALKAHGGSEVKTMGDGFMASFSSATKALECAIAMQRAFAERNESAEEPINVRVGVNAGEPIAENDDLYGTAVNLAARITAQGKGGEILASEAVRQIAAGKKFPFSDLGETTLRGFEDRVHIYQVSWRGED